LNRLKKKRPIGMLPTRHIQTESDGVKKILYANGNDQ